MSDELHLRFAGFSLSATALVRNKKGEVLVLRSPNPNRGWELPGGALEESESITDGLIRETLEETGIRIEVTNLVALLCNTEASRYIFLFLGERVSGKPTISVESEEVKWIPEASLLETLQRPKIKDRARLCLEFKGSPRHIVFQNKPYEILEDRFLGSGG